MFSYIFITYVGETRASPQVTAGKVCGRGPSIGEIIWFWSDVGNNWLPTSLRICSGVEEGSVDGSLAVSSVDEFVEAVIPAESGEV